MLASGVDYTEVVRVANRAANIVVGRLVTAVAAAADELQSALIDE